LGRNLDALAGDVICPAVIRTAQAALLVAAEPERHAAVGAELVDQPETVPGVAKCDEALREQLDPHRRAIRLGQLLGEQRRQPVAPEELAHRRARAGARQKFVLFCPHVPLMFRYAERSSAIWGEFRINAA